MGQGRTHREFQPSKDGSHIHVHVVVLTKTHSVVFKSSEKGRLTLEVGPLSTRFLSIRAVWDTLACSYIVWCPPVMKSIQARSRSNPCDPVISWTTPPTPSVFCYGFDTPPFEQLNIFHCYVVLTEAHNSMFHVILNHRGHGCAILKCYTSAFTININPFTTAVPHVANLLATLYRHYS